MIQLIITLSLLLIFIPISIFLFYVPGFAIVSRTKQELGRVESLVLSFGLGFILFTLLTIMLGFLNLRFLSIFILILINLCVFYRYKLHCLDSLNIFRDKRLSALIVLGILVQGLINFPSGYLFKDGLYFWSAQGHDGVRHIAFMEQIKKEFPPKTPLFSQEPLINYHYFVDIVMGETLRLFPFFSSWDIYFRFFPVLFSFLITTSTFAFVKVWKNKQIAYWAIFFTTFTGSFGWIVKLLRGNGPFGGETVFWASQINTVIGNPATAISIILVLTFLLGLKFYLENNNWKWFLICLILGSIISGFKVFGGMVLLSGLVAGSVIDLIFRRKIRLALISGTLGISNFIAFKSMTSGAVNLMLFEPWWLIRTLIVSGDRLNWIDLELRRQYYLSLHSVRGYLRVAEYETIAFLLFLIGNIGVRFVGFYELAKDIIYQVKTKFSDRLTIIIFFAMLLAFLMPLLFVQKGLAYNNIQFLEYFILFLGFFAAASTCTLLKKISSPVIKYLVITTIIILAVPTVVGNLLEFYGPGSAPNAKISRQELQALYYLRDNTERESIVLNAPFEPYRSGKENRPIPIYTWYSTSYIAAISLRTTYLSDEEQAITTGYPADERLNNMRNFFSQKDFAWNQNFLKRNKINYIYLPKKEIQTLDTSLLLDENGNQIRKFYENTEVVIYEVK
ncbi:MAG: hypothetical protein Q7R77_01590 [Candidatus Daviesbacteria bacterium]|nr:hypothetical protein [Candidatus Daviesbacteria bacterium]